MKPSIDSKNTKEFVGGRMIPEELEKSIQEVRDSGRAPYFVNATSGSTVLGAYDDLDKLSDVCR